MTWTPEDIVPELRLRLTRAARRAHHTGRTEVSLHDVVDALSSDIHETTPSAVTGSRRPTLPFAHEIDLALDRCVRERKTARLPSGDSRRVGQSSSGPAGSRHVNANYRARPVPEQETWEPTIGEVQQTGSAAVTRFTDPGERPGRYTG